MDEETGSGVNLDDMKCAHCSKDIMAHHYMNLKCPERQTIFQRAISDGEILKSFDATVWAKAFVEHVRRDPNIATDEATMTAWFANALMRGYDEAIWRSKSYKRSMRRILVPWYRRFFTSLDRFGH